MKRIVVAFFAFFSIILPLSASITKEGECPVYEGIQDVPFGYIDRRIDRLGGAGVALAHGIPALFYNPANLANYKKFTLNLPKFDISIFGITNMMNDNRIKPYINEAINTFSIKPIEDNITEIASAIFSNTFYNYTYAPLLSAQVDAGMAVGGFAFDAFAQLQLNTYNLTGGMGNIELVPSASIGASLGFAKKFVSAKGAAVSVGVSASVIEKAVAEGVKASDFDSSSGSGDFIEAFKNKRVSVGVAIPLCVGATISNPNDTICVSAVYRNIDIGDKKMYNVCTVNDFISNMFVGFGDKSQSLGNITIQNSPSFDIGVGFNPKLKFLNPRIEVDFVDALYWNKSVGRDMENYYSHLRIGAEVSLLNIIRVGAGLNGGRVCLGLRADLLPVVIDLDYGWIDSTPNFGEKLVDYISLQVKIGWDRTK